MRNFILSNFPFLEDDFDALTDYQLFCKLIAYVKKIYIDNEKFVNQLTATLEQMYNDGKFDSLIEEIVNLQLIFVYNTVSDMKSATNLVNGSHAKTLGYYSINDGGESYYLIRNKTVSDVSDDMFIVSLYDENLVAELIVRNNELNVKQIGITGNSSDDATSKLAIAMSSNYNLFFPAGTYNTKNQLNLTCHSLRGINPTVSIIKFNGDTNKQLIECTNIINLDLLNLCFDCGSLTDSLKTSVNLYNSENINIKNCEFKNGYGGHLRLNGSNNVLIEDTYFHDVSGDISNMGNAIYCHPVNNLTINRCRCNNLMEDFLYLDGGSDEAPCTNVLVNNCYIKNTSHNNNIGVSNSIGINGCCDNITVCNSVFTNNGSSVRCQGRYGYTPTNIFIYGNRMSDNIQNGLNVTANGAFVHDNIIYNNPQDGVYVLNSDNVVFSNNIVHNSGRNGVWFRNVNYLTCNDNRIYDNTTVGIVGGTDENNPITHATISNCEIYKTASGTQATGLQILYGDDIKVLSCHCYGNILNYDIGRITTTNFISQLNPSFGKSDICSLMYSNAIPTNGNYNQGDIVLYTSPSAGGKIGAVCVTAGAPGTWKEFGNISS